MVTIGKPVTDIRRGSRNKSGEKGSEPNQQPPEPRMPGDRHALSGRARSRSETGADSATRNSDPGAGGPESRAERNSESDSEADVRPQRASRLHLICPGCNKEFADMTKLRQHRAAYRTADPACRNAARKRPRTVRRDVDSARDADELIQRMMGNGSDSGLAARDAQSPFLQPRDEVGPGDTDSDGPTLTRKFTSCLQYVYNQFAYKFTSLRMVYNMSISSL